MIGAKRWASAALCVALAALPACGSADTSIDTPRAERIAESLSTIYAYCVESIQASSEQARPAAVSALTTLERDYRSAPNTPFAGEGRDQVRLALRRAARQLQACDPPLARRAKASSVE